MLLNRPSQLKTNSALLPSIWNNKRSLPSDRFLSLITIGAKMAKPGFQHLLCELHGGNGLDLTEPVPPSKHKFQVGCRLCKNPPRWINWCNMKQAEQLVAKYKDNIRVIPLPGTIPPPLQPDISPTKQQLSMDTIMSNLRNRRKVANMLPVNSTRSKWKSKRGIDLICPKHGPEALVIEDCGPGGDPPIRVMCKGYKGRNNCSHEERATEKQVEGILRKYPNCATRDNRQNAYEVLFEKE